MKILKWKINEKIVAVIAVVFFAVLCLLPLLLIARYDHPCADDYGYGYEAHMAWRSTHSITETLKAAIHTMKHTYHTWQGTFTSIFLMALTPAVFGEQYYVIVPYIMLGILTLSILYLSKVVVHDILKGSIANSIILAIILLFMMIEGIYTPASAFFWYNAAVHYTFMQAFMFLMIAFALRSATTDKKAIAVVACIMASFSAFVVSGGNYLNALIGMVLFVSLVGLFVFLFVWNKKKRVEEEKKNPFGKFYLLFIPFAVYTTGFVVNVIAPGNSIRGENFPDTPAVSAILQSFASGFQYCGEWMSLFTLVLMILALPALWAVTGKTKFRFRMPLLVLLFSFCLFSASFTSSHYGLGCAGLPRTFNNCKMLYHLLLVVNEAYFIGWLQAKLKASSKEKVKEFAIIHGLVFYAVVSVALAGVFLSCDDKEAYYPSYASFKYMREGFALHYHVQYLERITILNGPEKTVYLKEIEPKLNVLYVVDIKTNSGVWRNQQYARWHGKDAVILIPTEE